MVRTFSGSHDFKPEHLFLGIEVEDEDEEEAVEMLRDYVMSSVVEGRCPRCGSRPLPQEEGALPSGSMVTVCRCIPICWPCGKAEAISLRLYHATLAAPGYWPLAVEEVAVEDAMVASVMATSTVEVRPVSDLGLDPGDRTGWANPDNIVEPPTPEETAEALIARGADPVAVRHSLRFRRVSNRYPHEVALAYGGDLAAAMAASDEEVAEAVARWERSQGREPRDWRAIGRDERADDYEDD